MRKFLTAAAVFVAAFAVAGCGDYPRSRVHGKVTFDGKPLTNATVMFLTRDNQVYRAELKADGTYEVANVVRGPVSVSIQQGLPHVAPRADPDVKRKGAAAKGTGETKDQDAGRADPPASTPATIANPLPAKYADPKQSGLTFELKDADQEWSVDLK